MSTTDIEDRRRFIDDFVRAVPEVEPIVRAHSSDMDNEVLPHVLMADITRWIIGLHRACDSGQHNACGQRDHALAFLEGRMADASDVAAHDVIMASFLENLDQAGPDYDAVVARLGPSLRAGLPSA